MQHASKTTLLYGILATLFLAIVVWWLVFFSQRGGYLIERLDEAEAGLSERQIELVQRVADGTARMLMFEAAFIGLIGAVGMVLIWRSMRRELLVHRQQRDFLSAVTHELRSPIAAARLQVESLLLRRVPEEKVERYLERTLHDLDRLSKTVDQLLEAARATSGRVKLELKEIDLGDFARRAVGRIQDADRRAGTIEVEKGVTVRATADAGALETVLDNLLSNALKYGGEPPSVHVGVFRADNLAVVEVKDSGPGLGDKEAGRIFDPFVRGGHELVRRRPGIGLGLFLVSELVGAMGGQVRARNLEHGFVVRVSLPLVDTGEAA